MGRPTRSNMVEDEGIIDITLASVAGLATWTGEPKAKAKAECNAKAKAKEGTAPTTARADEAHPKPMERPHKVHCSCVVVHHSAAGLVTRLGAMTAV